MAIPMVINIVRPARQTYAASSVRAIRAGMPLPAGTRSSNGAPSGPAKRATPAEIGKIVRQVTGRTWNGQAYPDGRPRARKMVAARCVRFDQDRPPAPQGLRGQGRDELSTQLVDSGGRPQATGNDAI